MKHLVFRLICFILIITQLSISNLAQNKPSSNIQMPPKREQRMPTGCEWKSSDPRALTFGMDYQIKHLALCREAGDKLAISGVLRTIGNLHISQRRLAEALKAFQESLNISESVGHKEGIISAMLGIGQTHTNQGNKEQALESLDKALALSEELGDKFLIAQSLQSLGEFHKFHKNLDQTLVYLEKELKLREEIGDKRELAKLLDRIGSYYYLAWILGERNLSNSLEYSMKSLELFEEIGDQKEMSNTLNFIALIYRTQGYYAQALEFKHRSLRLKEGLTNSIYGNVVELSGIAHIYRLQGNLPKALEYFERVLNEYEASVQKIEGRLKVYPKGNSTDPFAGTPFTLRISAIQSAVSMAMILNTMGMIYIDRNDYDSAAKCFESALRIQQALEEKNEIVISARKAGDLNSRSTIKRFCEQNGDKAQNIQSCGNALRSIPYVYMATQRNLGLLNLRYGKYAPAMEHYRKLLSNCEKREIANVSCVAALTNIGYLYGLQGNSAKGMEFADRASSQIKLLPSFSLFEAHWLTGDAYRVLGQLDKARREFEEAISQYESTSAKISDESHRLTFIERTEKSPFELYIDVLMQLQKQRPNDGYDALALQASERFRARLLIELLNESRANIRQGVEPKLLARERELQQQLNERAEQHTRLLTGNYNAEQAAALQKEIDALTAEFQQTKAQIRINSPRYAALTQPQPLTASEIQRDLLDNDTVLLEYSLGVERSYLWVVTSTSLKTYELPKRPEIENDVRRVVGLLNDGKRWATDEKINAEYTEAAAPLSRKLLPPSVLSQLKGKRLAIVSDGALQYLPFGALPLPKESNTENKRQKTNAMPLAVEHEIVSLPSASALAVQRRETANRKQPAKSIAIFADPVFSETDERVSIVKANQSKVHQPAKTDLNRLLLERAFNWNGETNEPLSIARLPFTRREAEGIFAAAPSESSLKALDFEANRNNVLKSDLSDYRIVHFATHGLLNSEHPELSGIVLSLVNEQGQSVDGFLRLNEIYNMNLSADLVVLSACQTALGKEIRGEGLIGLTRGFMYAGSPRVVASLWKVDDVATAELMKLFYQKMLKEQMRPAAALRAAKVEMWKQKRWNAPFYWAAFELQGEWR